MKITAVLVTLLAASACTDSADPTPLGGPSQEATEGDVVVDEASATRIAGTYTRGQDTVEFEARTVETNLTTVTLKLHGMTVDATLDTRDGNRHWSQDAFATANGEDTAIEVDDVELLGKFVKAIEAEDIGVSVGDGLAFHFGAVINYWGQWTPAMSPTRIKFEDRDRAIDMCWWAGAADRFHSYDGHDCSTCSGDPVQGQGKTSCSSNVGYGNFYSPTYYYLGGSWTTNGGGAGHGNQVYEQGDCYGRYGAGCGSGKAYFQENGSHDHCVRNAHNLVSSWCSDELVSTTQPYNCSVP